jgi:signal transduction histidine kinase
MKLLVNTAQELSLARDLETVIQIVRTTARKLTGSDGATFILRENDSCYYADEDTISPLWKGLRFPIENCISGWAMLHRQVVIIEDIYNDPRIPLEAYQPTFVKSLAIVPIRTIDPIGAIGNYWSYKRLPTEEEVNQLQSLADITAVAFENVRIYNEMENRVKERTAQLEAANQELEAFSYSVSHDLRAPLRAIEGYMNIIRDNYASSFDEEGHQLSGRIFHNIVQMQSLIDALLHFFKTGHQELYKKEVSMQKQVEESCQFFRESVLHKNIAFSIGTLPPVEADSKLLKQVWSNLISNAVKYSLKKESIHIEIGSKVQDGFCTYYIKDNGVGFDMHYASKLFGVFQRLHTPQDFEGTGIGLAIVKKIISRHGGRVWATARPDQGATFYFSLPTSEVCAVS